MTIWIIIAAVIVALGLVLSIVSSLIEKWISVNSLMYACALCVAEAVVFGFTKLVAWVFSWHTALIVKITFFMMPLSLLLGVAFLLVGLMTQQGEKWAIATFSMVLLFIASAVSCAVFAWISSIAWKVVILSIVGLVLILLLVSLIIDSKPRAICYGDHCEVVEYYRNGREYRAAKKRDAQWEYRQSHGWDWGGPAV